MFELKLTALPIYTGTEASHAFSVYLSFLGACTHEKVVPLDEFFLEKSPCSEPSTCCHMSSHTKLNVVIATCRYVKALKAPTVLGIS